MEFGFGPAEKSRQPSIVEATRDVQGWLAEGGKRSPPGNSPPQMGELDPNQHSNP